MINCGICDWWLPKEDLECFGDCTKLDHDSIDMKKSIFAVINTGKNTNVIKQASFITAKDFGCVVGNK